MKHRETHPQFVEDCWACKALSVGISAHATPTRRPGVVEIDRKDSLLEADLPAYKRLRHAGLQPLGIDGSAALERQEPSCQLEVDAKGTIPRSELPRIQESIAASRDAGLYTEGGR